MSIDKAPAPLHETLANPMPFEEYRQLCDEQSQSYRAVGVLDEAKYNAALSDPRTEVFDINGVTAPLVVHSDHLDGFDVERTKKIAGDKTDVFLLAIPPEVLDREVQLHGDYEGSIVIVETDSNETARAKAVLPHIITTPQGGLTPYDFIDPRLEQADEHRTAWLAMYEGDVDVIGSAPTTKTLEQAFFDDGGEVAPENGFTLLSGPSIQEYPEILDQLWELFQDRFGWLGDYHPVSMEDTRTWFDSFLTHPETNTLIRYVDGVPKCAGFYQLDVANCDWINQDKLETTQAADDSGQPPKLKAFMAALAATADNLGHYSEDFVKFQCRIAALAGVEYRILMESSNMSSTYMPRILQGYMNDSGFAHLELRQTKRTDYWYLAA